MDPRERIEAALVAEALTADEWIETDDGPTAKLGRWRVTADDEPEGLYEGEVGELRACVVGAPEYHNERVCFTFTPDGYVEGEGSEVSNLAILAPIGAGPE